jgi:hypothetical protein
MSEHLNAIIRQPWQEVRRKVTDSPNTALHASEFSRGAKRDDTCSFRGDHLDRHPACADHGQVPTIAKVLQKLIAEIARSTPFKELHVIFEASQRADSLIEEAMQGFGLEENGKSIPVECYLMPKSAGEPSLEVADFIMHAVGRQARHNITQRGVFLPDFAAVCHSVDSRPLALSR